MEKLPVLLLCHYIICEMMKEVVILVCYGNSTIDHIFYFILNVLIIYILKVSPIQMWHGLRRKASYQLILSFFRMALYFWGMFPMKMQEHILAEQLMLLEKLRLHPFSTYEVGAKWEFLTDNI